MKFAAASVTALLVSTAHAFPNEPTGFRGLEWGDTIAARGDEFVLRQSSRDTQLFTRKGDKLAIGEAALSDISYAFYRGRFHAAAIKTQGGGNGKALFDAFLTQYGNAATPNRSANRYYWGGATALISLDCMPDYLNCMAVIASKRIADERRADENAAADRAKGDVQRKPDP